MCLVALVVAGWGGYLHARHLTHEPTPAAIAAVPTATVHTGALERTIRLGGQTSARRWAGITVRRFRGQFEMGMSGLVLTKLTPGGTLVRAGDLVAELDSESMRAAIDDLKASMDQSQLDVEQQKAQQNVDWQSFQQTVRSDKAEADQVVLDNGAAEVKTAVDQELLRLAVEEAEARYKQELKSLDFEKVALEAATRASEIEHERQRRQYERSLNDLQALTFRAPIDGMVVLQSVERSGGTEAQYAVGDQVNPGRSFMRVVDTSSMQLEAAASEAEACELRVGQEATVTLDAFPDLRFHGRVYSVGAIARPSRFESFYVRTVPVLIQIQGQSPRLLPDMSGAADALLGREVNRPLVPLAALNGESGHYFVYVLNGRSFEKRTVEVGLRNATQAAVLSGLKDGDRVALAKPPGSS